MSARVASSVLGDAWIARVVAKHWGWEDPRCTYWSGSHNDVYRVESRRGRAYLRITRRGWRSRPELEGEAALLRMLHRAGVRVPLPVRSRDGDFTATLRAPEGARHAMLLAEVPGTVPPMDAVNCRGFGRLVGQVHAAAERSRASFDRPALDHEHLVAASLRELEPLLGARDRALARRAGALLAPAVSGLPAAAHGLCHGDVHFGNLHRDAHGRLALLDFDCSGYGPRAYDLATFLWGRGWGFDRAARSARARAWNAFLDGYASFRDVGRGELQAAERLVAVRQVWHLGMQARLGRHFGQRWLRTTHFAEHLAFLREWLAAYRL